MLWTTDEEIGSNTSRALIEAEARRATAVLVFEPSLPGGALKTSRKGVGQFEMIVRGDLGARRPRSRQGRQRRPRAGAPDHGDRRAAGSRRDGVTVTVGVVSGGTRANVVPAEARATIDARAITRADADRVERAMKGACAADCPGASRR